MTAAAKWKKYLQDFAFLTFVMVLVPLIFQLPVEKRVAATMAGTLFVGSAVFVIVRQYRAFGLHPKLWYFLSGQFLVLFALPIWLARILMWNTEFNDISFLGIPGPKFHIFSTGSFLLLWVGTLIYAALAFIEKKKASL